MALTAGIVLSAVQIFLDYQDQQERNDTVVANALNIAAPGATQAAYELNARGAGMVIESLMVHEYFTKVEIISETGVALNTQQQDPKPHIAEPLIAALSANTKQYEIELYHQEGNLNVGSMRVSVHTATIMNDFFSRSIRQMIIGILRSLILTAILLYVFNLMITRPITTFSNRLKQIDPRDPTTVKIPARIEKANDELTDLAESTNNILKANQDYLVDIESQRQEAREFAEKLHHSERLSTVGKLTGGVAHDFNNILAIVMGCFELLQSDKNLHSDAKQLVGTGMTAAKRGANLTTQLLSYSRRQPLDPKPTNIKDFFLNIENMVNRALGENYKLSFKTSDELLHCLVDARQLETVLLNLAINARDAMPDGGRLTIAASTVQMSQSGAPTEVTEFTPGEYVCIKVTDNGTGMSQEVIDNAFEPYFTTKEIGKGSGLGLSMVYGFVNQSGGHIKITSEEGVGTTIAITLPKVHQPASINPSMNSSIDSISAANNETENMVAQRKTVLVVEDNASLGEVLALYLNNLKVDAVTATCASQALEKAEQHQHLDGALIDVMLPDNKNGPELAADLEKLHPDMNVIFMSGYTGSSIYHSKHFGQDKILLQKPFKLNDLKSVLDNLFIEENV